MTEDFLVEIGSEELPPKSLPVLEKAFADEISSSLKAAGLGFASRLSFSTPRRLAVLIEGLETTTPVVEQLVWGPPSKVAFDNDGKPTRAAEAFATKNNIDIDALDKHIRNDGKADKLCIEVASGGEPVSALLPEIISRALAKLPIAKRMRWGSRRSEFVRPVHWVVMLLGSKVVDAEILGLKAGRFTCGHRLYEKEKIEIPSAREYESLLSAAKVISSFDQRRTLIKNQVTDLATSKNATAIIEPELLDEVTALVEWPVALFGNFDEKFLSVPAEALIYSMSEHQKYFHLLDATNKLLPGFITVANLESKDPSKVIDGNERVIRPRLSDAAFFFESDKKMSLEKRADKLKSIVFQQKLGSVFDKSVRISELGKSIAKTIGANEAVVERAGLLCKADLASDMVLEFDKMQGVAGYYYALNDNEPTAVAEAIKEHYLPRFAEDNVPSSLEASAIALADCIDTLVGIFGIGQSPSGSKDPFALRRASIACLNIIVKHKLDISLDEVLSKSFSLYPSLADKTDTNVHVRDYIIERFRSWFQDDGIPVEVFNAVQANHIDQPHDIYLRVHAVNAFNQLEEAESLAAANKRVSNILTKNDNNDSYTDIDQSLFELPEEKALYQSLKEKEAGIVPLVSSKDYKKALFFLADLKPCIDQFFDNVMVMSDDEALRKNRVALLSALRSLFMQVADISFLVPDKK